MFFNDLISVRIFSCDGEERSIFIMINYVCWIMKFEISFVAGRMAKEYELENSFSLSFDGKSGSVQCFWVSALHSSRRRLRSSNPNFRWNWMGKNFISKIFSRYSYIFTFGKIENHKDREWWRRRMEKTGKFFTIHKKLKSFLVLALNGWNFSCLSLLAE